MELKKIALKADKEICIHTATGHFATNHSHINYYVDLTHVKSYHKMAKRAAALLAQHYNATQIDTIICLEGTNMLGAFIAEELSQASLRDMNSGADICVLSPELNSNNQLIFRENTLPMVQNRSVLLLLASVSTGKTINRALECLRYYSARIAGFCAVFSATHKWEDIVVHSVFTERDLHDYRTYLPGQCELCAQNKKIDAIVNSDGLSSL